MYVYKTYTANEDLAASLTFIDRRWTACTKSSGIFNNTNVVPIINTEHFHRLAACCNETRLPNSTAQSILTLLDGTIVTKFRLLRVNFHRPILLPQACTTEFLDSLFTLIKDIPSFHAPFIENHSVWFASHCSSLSRYNAIITQYVDLKEQTPEIDAKNQWVYDVTQLLDYAIEAKASQKI